MSADDDIFEALKLLRRAIQAHYGFTPWRVKISTREGEDLRLPFPSSGCEPAFIEPSAPAALQPVDAARHSPDFRWVHWQGQDYIFSPTQAAVVRRLWEAWEDGEGGLGQETLLEAAESESKRLRDLFKDHTAWGNVIKSCGKGIFSLAT